VEKKDGSVVVVRRRPDGIAQIVRVRARRRMREPLSGTLALVFAAVAGYLAALASAAAAGVLVVSCVAVEAWRSRPKKRPAPPAASEADVLPLRLTGSR
jgi:hypothetical protein